MPGLPFTRRQLILVPSGGAIAAVFTRMEAVPLTLEQQRRELVERVTWMGTHVSAQNELVQDWLRHSEIVRAARDGSFHDSFANLWQLRSTRPLVTSTRFGYGRFGVNGDPWISATAYAREGELNNEEMASLMPGIAALRGLNFYSPGAAMPYFCPLGKGLRYPPDAQGLPELKHFARIVVNSGHNFADFDLKYYRYFFIESRHLGGQAGHYDAVVAYAFQQKGIPNRQIVYAIPDAG